MAEAFAGRRDVDGPARFQFGSWSVEATGAPVLASALCAFDCRVIEIPRVATHAILIGEVAAIGGAQAGQGLIYRNRRFGAF